MLPGYRLTAACISPSPMVGTAARERWLSISRLFSIQVQIKHSPHECLSQNVKVMTYVAMLALMCVCVVCIVSLHILVCMCAMFDVFTEQGALPRINEILTPKACLTLLVNTLILGEPYSVHPFFVFTQLALLVSQLSSTLLSILHWVRHGNLLSDRVMQDTTALYSPRG